MVDPPSSSCTVPRTAPGSPAPLRSSHVLFGSGTAAQSVCLCTSWSSTRLSAAVLSASLSVWSVLLSYHSFLCFLLGRAEASAYFISPSDICAGWLLNATRPSRDHRVRDRHLCDPITERDCKDTMNKLCFANFSATFLQILYLFSKMYWLAVIRRVVFIHKRLMTAKQ